MVLSRRQDEPKVTHVCPMCNKLRMVRSKGFEFDPEEMTEINTPSGKTIEVPANRCGFCDQKIVRKHFQPSKSDVKKVVKAMADQEAIPEDKSLEDML